MTSSRAQLKATIRTITGKKVKSLRKNGVIPAHVFGNGKESVSISADAKQFAKIYKETGETGLIDLLIEGEASARPVLVDDAALHALTGEMLHVDFHEVNLNEVVTATIPIETVGESEAVKNGGVLVMAYNDLEVEALPTDLPEHFEVDLSKLATVGADFKISELSYDRSKVNIIDLEQDTVLATIQAPKEEKVEESVTPVEVEILKGATTEEGKEAQATGGAVKPAEEAKSDKK